MHYIWSIFVQTEDTINTFGFYSWFEIAVFNREEIYVIFALARQD